MSAWIGINGTIRALHENHHGMLNGIFDSLKSLIIAMTTEDFGPSHKECMGVIGGASMEVVVSTSKLLIKCAESAADGSIDSNEQKELEELEKTVHAKVSALAKQFDGARRKYNAIAEEMLSESFFVFVLSAYARKTCEYSEILRTKPPQGVGCSTAF